MIVIDEYSSWNIFVEYIFYGLVVVRMLNSAVLRTISSFGNFYIL